MSGTGLARAGRRTGIDAPVRRCTGSGSPVIQQTIARPLHDQTGPERRLPSLGRAAIGSPKVSKPPLLRPRNIHGIAAGACLRRGLPLPRQGELKDGTPGYVCRGPHTAAMRLDDRPADRQPHAHAIGFRRKKSVEDSVDVLRIDPCSCVSHRDQQIVRIIDFSLNPHGPRTIRYSIHCINSIHE